MPPAGPGEWAAGSGPQSAQSVEANEPTRQVRGRPSRNGPEEFLPARISAAARFEWSQWAMDDPVRRVSSYGLGAEQSPAGPVGAADSASSPPAHIMASNWAQSADKISMGPAPDMISAPCRPPSLL